MNPLAPFRERNPVLAGTGVAHLLLALVFLTFSLVDSRELLGLNVWFKPAKFALSIAAFTLSLAWFWPELAGERPLPVAVPSLIAAAMATEIVLITFQAARGVRSHFNHDTAFDSLVYGVMGAMIGLSTLVTACLALRLGFRLVRGGVTSAYPASILFGLLLFLAGSLVGGMMSAQDRHSVGTEDGGPGLPFLNWNGEAGDLRVAHFLGLHALQVLPLTGFLIDRTGLRPGFVGSLAGALGYAVFFTWQLRRALQGFPAW